MVECACKADDCNKKLYTVSRDKMVELHLDDQRVGMSNLVYLDANATLDLIHELQKSLMELWRTPDETT